MAKLSRVQQLKSEYKSKNLNFFFFGGRGGDWMYQAYSAHLVICLLMWENMKSRTSLVTDCEYVDNYEYSVLGWNLRMD